MWDEDEDELAAAATSAAMQAINEIRRGAYADAITTLEREFMPKWLSAGECEDEYKKAQS